MQIFPSLLFGIAASLDALLMGVTYGIRRVHINLWQNFLVSLITLLGTCLSIYLGSWLIPFLPAAKASKIGSSILILLGIYYIIKFMICSFQKYLYHKKNVTTKSQLTSAEHAILTLSFAEVFILGLTLSLNNMGIGISASIAGLPLSTAAIITLFFSIVFLLIGNRLGRCKLLQLTGRGADPLSGLLLIALGVCELIL